MGLPEWIATFAGTALVLGVIVEVLLTVLHSDVDGPVVRGVHRLLWRGFAAGARRLGRGRRSLLSFAAPSMMLATLVLWLSMLLVGFALIFWPHLERGFTAKDALGSLGFTDALYVSGVTGTVLGYGDITPLVGWLELLCVIESAFGFALVTGILTWLVGIVGGVHARAAFTQRVNDLSGGTGDGVELLLRLVRIESASMTHARLLSLDQTLQSLRAQFRQYPILDIERTLRGIFEEVADQYLGERIRRALASSAPTAPDRARVERIRSRILLVFQEDARAPAEAPPDLALSLAARAKIALDALDEYTGWRLDSDDPAARW